MMNTLVVNDTFLARAFLIGLGVIGLYTAVSGKSPDEVTLIPCLFRSVTNIPCPGCGMTRACLALTHGHFTEAWRYHPFSFLVVGLAIGVALFPSQLKKAWMGYALKIQNLIFIFGIVFCLFIWILKLTGLTQI